ncbi:MAG: hypothetical protein QG646_95 [Euryarchaeota archaeon]|nr:hypothetical protein [Euryarchaeota archaeon]
MNNIKSHIDTVLFNSENIVTCDSFYSAFIISDFYVYNNFYKSTNEIFNFVCFYFSY